jgi:hypothetical protein
MRIGTSNYEWTHGRKPRGHGLWTFLVQRREGEWTELRASGSYVEACRAVKAEAKGIGGISKMVVNP